MRTLKNRFWNNIPLVLDQNMGYFLLFSGAETGSLSLGRGTLPSPSLQGEGIIKNVKYLIFLNKSIF